MVWNLVRLWKFHLFRENNKLLAKRIDEVFRRYLVSQTVVFIFLDNLVVIIDWPNLLMALLCCLWTLDRSGSSQSHGNHRVYNFDPAPDPLFLH